MMQKVEICGVNTSGLPKLTQKESEELMKRLKEGDEEAREQFVVGNMRLVLSLVKRFWAKRANADDVFQAGCIGLLKAIDNFDLRVGVKFSTYAVPMIMGEIKRYLRDGNSLRVSRSIRDTAYRVLKTRESIEEKDEEAYGVDGVLFQARDLRLRDAHFVGDLRLRLALVVAQEQNFPLALA